MKFDNLAAEHGVPTKEMTDWFIKRTERHIQLVQKYCAFIEKIHPEFKGLTERANEHDASKLEEPEKTPYIFITWQYKMKKDGKKYDLPGGMKEKASLATEHHVKSNDHHPEKHSEEAIQIINREDRGKPPAKVIDATKMGKMDIAEMVADWCGVSEEVGTSPKDWADKNVGIRWEFGKENSDLIYKLIGEIWKEKKKDE